MTRLSILLVALSACGAGQDSPPPSSPTVDVAVGAQPVGVAAGDLDGDGAVDLASANGAGRSVSVRMQRAGSWIATAELTAPEQLHIVQLADLDGDRDLDVAATAHDAGTVWVWLNDGAARFAAAPGSPFAAIAVARPHNHGLVAGDLDRDGDADLVAADQTGRMAAVLLGGPGGKLTAAPGSPISLGGQPYPPALGDIDGDGSLDLVAPLIDSQAIAVFLNDGRARFRRAPGSPHRTAHERPYGVALADVDGDLEMDVIASHDDTDAISVLRGAGGGRLVAAPTSPVSAGRRLGRPAAADVDGDRKIDLVGAGSGARVVMKGNGRAGFAAPQIAGSSGWMAITADLDGDGKPDVIVPEQEGAVLRLWLSRGGHSARSGARSRVHTTVPPR